MSALAVFLIVALVLIVFVRDNQIPTVPERRNFTPTAPSKEQANTVTVSEATPAKPRPSPKSS